MADIIIVGAGCAGLTAALYAARAGKSVLVLESEGVGGQIASAPRVENYPGIKEISGIAFSDALCAQAESFGAELDFARALSARREESGFTVMTDDERKLPCQALILATGARHRKLGVAREDELAGVSYCAVCDAAFYKDRDAAVIGGGSAALQSAELLSGLCRSVTLIHRRNEFRGEAELARRVSKLPNVALELGFVPDELLGDGELTGIVLKNVQTGEKKTVRTDGLFVCVGQTPDNAVFAPLAELDEAGYIKAAEDCRTSCQGVFAAGDCRTKAVRQLSTAAADGATAALAACGYIDALK